MNNKNLLDSNNVKRWPKKLVDKKYVLEYIIAKILFDKNFTEKEINEYIIKNIVFDDYVLVRRELIEKGYLNRTKDCKEYWRIKIDMPNEDSPNCT